MQFFFILTGHQYDTHVAITSENTLIKVLSDLSYEVELERKQKVFL